MDETEYIIEKIVDNDYGKGKLVLNVLWYGYPTDAATWEPVAGIFKSVIIDYFGRKRLSVLPQVKKGQVQ